MLAPSLVKSAARNTIPFHLGEMPEYLASVTICLFPVYVRSCHWSKQTDDSLNHILHAHTHIHAALKKLPLRS